jgi:hypothetical protein
LNPVGELIAMMVIHVHSDAMGDHDLSAEADRTRDHRRRVKIKTDSSA